MFLNTLSFVRTYIATPTYYLPPVSMLHPVRLLQVGRKILIGNNNVQQDMHFPYQEGTPPTAQDQRLGPNVSMV